MTFQIVKGDYGQTYRGIIKGKDYSLYSASFYLWNLNRQLVINGAQCSVIRSGNDTYIDYTPSETDFRTIPAGTYFGMFKLSKPGTVEHTLKFTFEVFDYPPP